jgi:hypothetical protein
MIMKFAHRHDIPKVWMVAVRNGELVDRYWRSFIVFKSCQWKSTGGFVTAAAKDVGSPVTPSSTLAFLANQSMTVFATGQI